MPLVPSNLGQMSYSGAGGVPTQNLNTNSQMFGSQQAEDISKVGDILSKEAQDRIRTEDERASMEVEQQVRDWSFEATQGENGVYRKRGGNAIGSTEVVKEDYSKFSSNLLKGKVVSASTRQRIEQYISERGDSVGQEVSRYEMKEKRSYDDGLREARIKGAIEDAATYYNDPAKLNESKNKIRTTLSRSAADNGWSPEETQQQVESEISAMHENVINRMMVQRQGNGARAYLNANRKEIDGADIIAIEKMVQVSVESENGQRGTDLIMALGKTESEALAMARSKYSGKQRDEVVKRLKVRYGESASIDVDNTKSAQKSGWDKIAKGGTPDDLTPQELAAAGRQVDSMWTMAKNSKSRGKGFALSSDTGVVQDWLGKDDIDIANEDLTALQPTMTENDWNKVKKRQLDAGRAIKDLKDRPGQGATVERLLKEFAPKSWNVGAKSASNERRAQAQRARDNMSEFIRASIDKTGKLPTDGEMRKEASRIMTQTKTDGFLWTGEETVISEQGNTPISELLLDDEAGATGVPENELIKVKKWLSDNNYAVTPNNIKGAWEQRDTK